MKNKKAYEIKEDILNVVNISKFIQKKDEVLKRVVEEGTMVVTLFNKPVYLLTAVTDDNIKDIASGVKNQLFVSNNHGGIATCKISNFINNRKKMLDLLKKEGMIALIRFNKPFCLVIAVDEHNINKAIESIKIASGENILNEIRQNKQTQ